jgi:hypothetical protein
MNTGGGAGLVVRTALLALVVTVGAGWRTADAQGRGHLARADAARASRSAGAPASGRNAGPGAKQAPSGPPLTSGSGAAGAGGGEQDEGGSPQGEADPLVSNGLGSPLCKGALGGGELSGASRRDCETSGFVAAAAPTGDYGIDVHIDTGVLGLSLGGLLTTVQDLFVTPLWMALVWAVHALVVMLEWCFTIDLLDSASVSGGVARGLRQMQGAFTEPWLASVLAVASVMALYNGLVRRRVAETVGQALLVLAMMGGGMWVMLDPSGTVGALGGWANEASLGTLAAAAGGTPARADRTLGDSMTAVFAAAVEVPWCYLEFGDVRWCRNPAQLDPRLRAAGLKIATSELVQVGCGPDAAALPFCAAPGSAQARALEHSAELLRDARSNGAIFLALPANGPARNSINEQGSLLRVMCQSSEATSCRGPMAAQAEFRTDGGTWARVGGLVLIVAGALGMLLLLGFIALRLLAAALLSLLYLLLAPAAVLAPALGESGRAVFRKWAVQLLTAVVSKLLFSFLLGVVLAILAILADLEALGWWTQWLLMSAFWWGAYARRHQALAIAGGALGRQPAGRPRPVGQRVSDALDTPRRVFGLVRSTRQRLSKQAPSVEERRKLRHAGVERARAGTEEQAKRTLEHEHREASVRAEAAPEIHEQLSARRAQLERVRDARGKALAGGDARRAAELGHRAQRIEAHIEREQHGLNAARRVASEGEQAHRATGNVHGREQAEERDRFLDAQAALPAAARARGSEAGERRDYGALAGLAGYGRGEYEQLDPRGQRAARLEVDRELALRRELNATAGDVAMRASEPRLRRREKRKANDAFDRRLEQRMREGGQTMPASRMERSGLDAWRRDGLLDPGSGGVQGSSVMRDANEVARRRKRQLGPDRR